MSEIFIQAICFVNRRLLRLAFILFFVNADNKALSLLFSEIRQHQVRLLNAKIGRGRRTDEFLDSVHNRPKSSR